jgi:hypothetical protein
VAAPVNRRRPFEIAEPAHIVVRAPVAKPFVEHLQEDRPSNPNERDALFRSCAS